MNQSFFGKIKDLKFLPSNNREFLEWAEKNDDKNVLASFRRETGIRTDIQNNSLHLWCEQVAKELNDSGQSIQEVLKKTVEIEWSKDSVKEIMWKGVQKAITGKKSTKELDKVEDINKIYEHLNRFLAEKCNGIHVPFPNKDLSPQ